MQKNTIPALSQNPIKRGLTVLSKVLRRAAALGKSPFEVFGGRQARVLLEDIIEHDGYPELFGNGHFRIIADGLLIQPELNETQEQICFEALSFSLMLDGFREMLEGNYPGIPHRSEQCQNMALCLCRAEALKLSIRGTIPDDVLLKIDAEYKQIKCSVCCSENPDAYLRLKPEDFRRQGVVDPLRGNYVPSDGYQWDTARTG